MEAALTSEPQARRPYEEPTLTVIGSFEEITQQTSVGTKLDAALPAGTPLEVVLQHLS